MFEIGQWFAFPGAVVIIVRIRSLTAKPNQAAKAQLSAPQKPSGRFREILFVISIMDLDSIRQLFEILAARI